MRGSIFLLLVLLITVSCNKESSPDIFKKAGETITVKRDLGSFTRVLIRDEFDVELIQDSVYGIEIEFGENLIAKISTTIVEDELQLENNNKFNWVRELGLRIKIKLHCKKVDNFELVGDGSLFNRDTFYGDTVNFNLAGTNNVNLIMISQWATFRCSNVGNLMLKGSCGILSGTVEETAIFDGRDFLASDAYFYHYSLANSYIRAEQLYGLNLFGRGNLYYLQEPLRKFDRKESGQGKIIKL
jgi:hypothetical protein